MIDREASSVSSDASPALGRPRATIATWANAVRAVASVARREYRIAFRVRWTLGIAVLFGVFSAAIVGFSGARVGPTGGAAVIATLAELSVYLVPLTALVFGYPTVVGAADRGTLDMLFALPVARPWVLLGKYLGRVAALWSGLVVGFLPGGLVFAARIAPGWIGHYAAFVIAALGAAAVFLGISVAISTIAREKTHALGGALLVWVWFVLVHDLVALGLVATFALPDAGITALVVTNPAALFRVLVLSGLPTTAGGFGAVLAATGLSGSLAVVGLLGWLLAPVLLAVRLVDRRRP